MPKAEPLKRCPRCGYEVLGGEMVVVRIWVSKQLQIEWREFSKEYDTQMIAFNELLRKAKLYTKIEKSRIAVEPPTKP